MAEQLSSTAASTYGSEVIPAGERFRRPPPVGSGGLRGSGGGGTYDDMEARVAKLEAHVEHLVNDVSAIKTDMKDSRERIIKIEGKLDHVPTYWDVVKIFSALLGLLTALILFQNQIRAAFGIS